MNLPSSTWQIERPGPPGYLFVEAESGRIFPVVHIVHDGRSKYYGFGLWFHDYDDHEIVTTHIKRSGIDQWLHEYYRISGDYMQWRNYCADILHLRVTEEDIPIECLTEFKRLASLSALRERPAYDPSCIRAESRLTKTNKPAQPTPGNVLH